MIAHGEQLNLVVRGALAVQVPYGYFEPEQLIKMIQLHLKSTLLEKIIERTWEQSAEILNTRLPEAVRSAVFGYGRLPGQWLGYGSHTGYGMSPGQFGYGSYTGYGMSPGQFGFGNPGIDMPRAGEMSEPHMH